ncbi:MAG: hypothetical protein V3T17_16335 [Pseudomonadales bacterium]
MPANNTFSLAIPCEHPCYVAHFPGNPIVPGALLLQWVLRLLKQHYAHVRVSGLHTIKFLSVVKPGDDCRLAAVENATSTQLKINLLCNGNPALKGVLDIETFKNP